MFVHKITSMLLYLRKRLFATKNHLFTVGENLFPKAPKGAIIGAKPQKKRTYYATNN